MTRLQFIALCAAIVALAIIGASFGDSWIIDVKFK